MSTLTTSGPVRAELVVEVSDSCEVPGALSVAATVFLPPAEALADGATVLYALPGGGYSRGYYDMHFPGHADYSQAEHHTARGLVLVAIDHLGVGQSTPQVCDKVRVEDIAAANHAAVQAISNALEEGNVAPGYPPVRIARRVGVGQSMGGAVTLIMAAAHRTYDAIAILGFSGIHTVLPFPDEIESSDVAARAGVHSRQEDVAEQSVAETAKLIPGFLYPFFWSDVPADIVQADIGGRYPFREKAPAFGSATVPSCAVAMLSAGYVAAEAAAVQCPVFIGLGERDTAAKPLMEPSAYEKSTDITLFICEQMAHMHNFASSRRKLWDRLTGWCQALP
ncbi:alpha/beta fold hydrolase [Mycobacterium sp.]|uniref:alpha/beta fold hydrolase n=1 Tax=Mycobacterium sp. TaxID=1785 RepID=UPI0012221671|nr:alpha/beta fold hydrolase [Mycobacterium sp.]TAM65181.1 MAG: alpha/beta hydrolase [Mycobacterium sp.]